MAGLIERFLGGKKKKDPEQEHRERLPKRPKFAELKEALPENLKNEFQQLSDDLKDFINLYGGYEGEPGINIKDIDAEGKLKLDRYDELVRIAEQRLEKQIK